MLLTSRIQKFFFKNFNALHFVAMAKSLWCAFQSHVATAHRALIMGSSYLVLKVAHLELKPADLLKDYIFTHRMV